MEPDDAHQPKGTGLPPSKELAEVGLAPLRLLREASLFLTVVGDADVEDERRLMEWRHSVSLRVHSRETVTRSGAQMTRVEWEIVDEKDQRS